MIDFYALLLPLQRSVKILLRLISLPKLLIKRRKRHGSCGTVFGVVDDAAGFSALVFYG